MNALSLVIGILSTFDLGCSLNLNGNCYVERDYNYGIDGYNEETITGLSVDECAKRCQEASYPCVSLDVYLGICYTHSITRAEAVVTSSYTYDAGCVFYEFKCPQSETVADFSDVMLSLSSDVIPDPGTTSAAHILVTSSSNACALKCLEFGSLCFSCASKPPVDNTSEFSCYIYTWWSYPMLSSPGSRFYSKPLNIIQV